MNHKYFYRRNLPHIQPLGSSFFVTFSLEGSIPIAIQKKLSQRYYESEEKIKHIRGLDSPYFQLLESNLDKVTEGPVYLDNQKIAEMVFKHICSLDRSHYQLYALCVMANHVHMVIDTNFFAENQGPESAIPSPYTLDQIMKKIKGPTAVKANKILNRSGKFWRRESYDILINTPESLLKCILYVAQNPVKAGIVTRWKDYKWTFVSSEVVF